jgi:type IV pilus assembly protein PilB
MLNPRKPLKRLWFLFYTSRMDISDSLLKELLQKNKKISSKILTELVEQSAKHEGSLQDLVLKRKILTEKELTKLYGASINTPFVDLSEHKINPKILNKIPEQIARKYQAVLFDINDNVPKLAMADPEDLQAIDFLEKLFGKNLKIYIATPGDIQHVLGGYGGTLDTELTKVIPETAGPKDLEVKAEEVAEDSPVAKTVNLIIDYALKSEASDIHIEPREDKVQIRYRIDGVLREANTLPRSVLASLVSRIKIMADLKIDEHRKPQDGRFKIADPDRTVAVRVSTLPIMDGEKVVMRLLDESSRALTLEELGFNPQALESMHDAMSQPHGLILVTGPTGAGKSTTLYSVLSTLNTANVNISTVEDPVEYRIVGVNQTQVNPQAGMTFVNGLRALLRQDPNIIMVGEIRDGETAELAIQASLTGHLVLSTLHTNNAATTLPRLLDMGAEPFLIASTVRVVVGQRLVRKLCPNCKISYSPTEYEDGRINKHFDFEKIKQQLKNLSAQSTNPAAAINIAASEKLRFWKPGKGCEICNATGYKGRIGIYEVLGVNESIAKLILSNSTSHELERQAITDGMITMKNDGLIKVLQGLTSIEEILRVTH